MLSPSAQPAILSPLPPCGRSLVFQRRSGVDSRTAVSQLARSFDVAWGALGIGAALAVSLDRPIKGLRPFLAVDTPAGLIPSNQGDLWIFLRGPDRATIFDRSAQLGAILEHAFFLADSIDTFSYRGRDLTGYIDGTENPKGKKRNAAALVGPGALAASSFVVVQRWAHDFAAFNRHTPAERDDMIGRRKETNEELSEAPASAHVKRSAQESFDPEAFMYRRSMPWSEGGAHGLEFIAYGRSLDAFDQIMRRMSGQEDGIVDALFTFSKPITGGYYWCPPVNGGRLDLAALGL